MAGHRQVVGGEGEARDGGLGEGRLEGEAAQPHRAMQIQDGGRRLGKPGLQGLVVAHTQGLVTRRTRFGIEAGVHRIGRHLEFKGRLPAEMAGVVAVEGGLVVGRVVHRRVVDRLPVGIPVQPFIRRHPIAPGDSVALGPLDHHPPGLVFRHGPQGFDAEGATNHGVRQGPAARRSGSGEGHVAGGLQPAGGG